MPNKEEKEDAQNLKLQHTHRSRCTGLYFCHKGGNFYHWRTEHTLSVGELQNAIGVLTHESFSLVLRLRLEIAILEHALLCAVTLHSAYCITVSRRWVHLPYTQSHSGYSQAERALHNLSLALYKRKANIPISRLLSPLLGINKQALKYFKRRKVKKRTVVQCHSTLKVELGRKTAGNTVSLALTPPGETDGSSVCVLFQTQVEVVAIKPTCATVPQLARPQCSSIISYTCARKRLLGNHYGREFARTFAFIPVLGLWPLSDESLAGPLSQQNPDMDIAFYCCT